jgi:hypothetical protein
MHFLKVLEYLILFNICLQHTRSVQKFASVKHMAIVMTVKWDITWCRVGHVRVALKIVSYVLFALLLEYK